MNIKNILLVLICIVLYGVSSFLKRIGLNHLHPYQFLLATGCYYSLTIPLWYFIIRTQNINTTFNKSGILIAGLYAGLNIMAAAILALLLNNSTNSGALIVMINFSSLITILLCFFFLNEQLTIMKICGFILAIISLILLNTR